MLTWKIRPSGEYVLAERSYPVPMDVIVVSLCKGRFEVRVREDLSQWTRRASYDTP